MKPGGKLGLSVWGRRENSPYFRMLPKILTQHGIELPAFKSYFHLGDRLETVISRAGFANPKQTYLPVYLNESKEVAFYSLIGSPFYAKSWDNIEETTKESIMKTYYKEYDHNYSPKSSDMVSFEANIVVANNK